MKTLENIRSAIVILMLGLCAALACLLASADDAELPADLGGVDRALAFLSTDKPMYRPGETVRISGILVNPLDNALIQRDVPSSITIKSPKGEKVHAGMHGFRKGVAGAFWKIPETSPGGSYIIRAEFNRAGYPPVEIPLDVRDYRVPRLKMRLDFLRKAYGPGDEVQASLEVERTEGGIPAGAVVSAIARLDGREIWRKDSAVDAKGACAIRFGLPAEIRDGFGTLAVIVRDGGVQETEVRTIPVVLNRIAAGFHPEGGDLVAGLDCRVYLECRDTRRKPADVSGRVVDSNGTTVAAFETSHEGRGRFDFKPEAGKEYFAVFDKPSGNTQKIALPSAKQNGFVLRALKDSFESFEPFAFRIDCTRDAKARLEISRLDRKIHAIELDLKAFEQCKVRIPVKDTAFGVLRATLFVDSGIPAAERLVFRKPPEGLKIEVTADPARSIPGGRAKLNVKASDGEGKPVVAFLFISVADDAVLEKVEKRERAPRLAANVLLGHEVLELADCDSYFTGGQDSALRLDLLLATQGWRRFAFADRKKFVEEHGEAALRCLAVRMPPKTDQIEEEELWDARKGLEGGDRGPGIMEKAGGKPAGVPPEAPIVAPAPAPAPTPIPGPMPAEDAKAADELGRRARKIASRYEWVREYAHRSAPPAPGEARSDFTETVFWCSGIETGPDGNASFEFSLSHSITVFRARVDAITGAGLIASADACIESRRPFYVEPKLPLHMTAGDLANVPVAVVNSTSSPFKAEIRTSAGKGLTREGNDPSIDLAANSSGRAFLMLAADAFRGEAPVTISASGGGFTDEVRRSIPVFPAGFPMQVATGGKLSKTYSFKVVIPASALPGSIATYAAVYPAPLGSLVDALKGLLAEPCGCFEQTSSSAYPNIMVMRYLETHSGVDPAISKHARELVDRGYKRLVGFECKEKGYEWFGGDPGHEALTAYGLLEFSDMKGIVEVDSGMIDRTRKWLLDRRDGAGGFKRNPRALDSFGSAPQDTTNAYVVWALVEAGEKGLEKEIEALKRIASASSDSYVVALAANVLHLAGDKGAEELMRKLEAAQGKDGAVTGALTSVTCSSGTALAVETTSLSVIAWLRSGAYHACIEKAAEWLFAQCKEGRFGSTQSTILALRAIIGYDRSHAGPKAAGQVRLVVDGAEAGSKAFKADEENPVELPPFAGRLSAGEHVVEIVMEGGAEMPFAVSVNYSDLTPPDGRECKVRLKTALSSSSIREGEAVELEAAIMNTTAAGLPMTVAIIGIPGGLDLDVARMKELVKSGAIDFFETRLRDVVVYKRCMAPNEVCKFTMTLVAAVPGRYSGAASRAYLYYTDEHKHWNEGFKVEVK